MSTRGFDPSTAAENAVLSSEPLLCSRMGYRLASSRSELTVYAVRIQRTTTCILSRVPRWHHRKSPKHSCSRPKRSKVYRMMRRLRCSKWITVGYWVVSLPQSMVLTFASEILPPVSPRRLASRPAYSPFLASHRRLCLLCPLVSLAAVSDRGK